MCCTQFYKNICVLEYPNNNTEHIISLESNFIINNYLENNNNYEIVKIPLHEQSYYIFGSLISIVIIYFIIIDIIEQKNDHTYGL